MELRLLIGLVVLAAVTLAGAGWTVEGVRWLLGGPIGRPRLASA